MDVMDVHSVIFPSLWQGDEAWMTDIFAVCDLEKLFSVCETTVNLLFFTYSQIRKPTKLCAKCVCVSVYFLVWKHEHMSEHLCPCLSVTHVHPSVFRASPNPWHLFKERYLYMYVTPPESCFRKLRSFSIWLVSLIVQRGDKTPGWTGPLCCGMKFVSSYIHGCFPPQHTVK